MSTVQRGLGPQGLDLLIKKREQAPTDSEILKIPISSLVANPQQPRRSFPQGQLEELAHSIKNQGVLQPVLVRPIQGSEPPKYEIVAGERRWRAGSMAGLKEIPAIVKELSERDVLIVSLMENLQRTDLTALEEAQGLQRLKEEFGLSQEELAQSLGKSRSAIANTLRLLSLSHSARTDLAEGRISAGHARALLAITEVGSQETLRARIVAGHLSVREAENLAAIWKEHGEIPDAAEVLPPRRSPVVKNATEDAAMSRLAESIGAYLSLPVTIRGGNEKGSIRVSYSSSIELEQLLLRLGMPEGAA